MRSLGLGIVTVLASAAFAAPAAAQPVPGLDATFGVDGIAGPDAPQNPVVSGVALQPDGKILVLTRSYTRGFAFLGNSLFRLNPDGSPDTTFDGDGVFSDPATADTAGALALQPDGKILLGRYRLDGFTITRLNPDGSVDAGFGSGGTATATEPGMTDSFVRSILVQPDGKIVAAGSAGRGDLYVARFDGAGNPDLSFAADGLLSAQPPVFGFSESEELDPRYLHLQVDGRLVVSAGYTYDTPSGDSDPPEERDGTIVTRVNPDGTLDPTYGGSTNGFVEVERGGPTLLAVNGGARLLFAGSRFGVFDIQALSTNGTSDPTFTAPEFSRLTGSRPVSRPLTSGFITGLAEASDGRLVAVGQVSTLTESDFESQLGVAMTEPNGDVIGAQRFDLGSGSALFERTAEQPDGKLITAGSIDGELAVVRLAEPDNLVCVLTTPEVFAAQQKVVKAAKKLKRAKRRDKGVQQAKQKLRDARADARAEQAVSAAALGC